MNGDPSRSYSPQIREQDDWEKNLKPGGKYYFTRLVPIPPYVLCATC